MDSTVSDNIFESDCQAIINTVNCVGVMGGGLAKQFRQRYPYMNDAYQRICARGEMRPGRIWPYWDGHERRWLINFPTKLDWRNPSELSYIEDGLKDLRRVTADLHLDSIAVPPLGCGLGGLRWDDVLPLIKEYLGDLDRVRVEIYPPDGKKYDL